MHLFIYGTLLVPRIWEAVTGRPDVEDAPARLRGHAIYRVEGGDFPAIVATGRDSDVVPGRIIHDLDSPTLDRLDAYEDTFYERVAVPVETGNRTLNAQTYRLPEELAGEILSNAPWTLDWFEEYALERYWDRLFA